jgi:CheY-like chemotaxis protein
MLKRQRVLIVDDNATSAAILASSLRDIGLQPQIVTDPAAGVEMIDQADRDETPFAIAIIDANMPEIDGFVLARHLRERHRSEPAIVMMLPPVDRKLELAQCQELGIQGYFSKPFKPADLLKAILKSCGLVKSSTTEMEIDLDAPRTKSIPEPTEGYALKLLLVDDNPFNQKVGVLKLQRQGHEVTVAGSGQQALEKLEQQAFDIVFMDMHMPEMDGLQATARIRAFEAGIGRRTPIVAMTADVGDGVREHCLQGGMDSYVAKPIQDDELFEVIRTMVPPSSKTVGREAREKRPAEVVAVSQAPAAPPNTPLAPHPASLVNRTKLLSSVGGSLPVLRQLIAEFRQDVGPLMEELTRGVETNDCKMVHRAGHTLKGMINFFDVPQISELAMHLEKMGAIGDCTQADAKLAALERDLDRLQVDLAAV